MIFHQDDVCRFLAIPAVPKKRWDGEKSFKDGVAVTDLVDGTQAYAVATYDSEQDNEPRIRKVFAQVPFRAVSDIYVVPNYMDKEIDTMDLDEDSKRAAKEILDQATALETKDTEDKETETENTPEWVFDEIHNIDEAKAWIKSYRKRNKIRGSIPKTEENIKAYLLVVKANQKRKIK